MDANGNDDVGSVPRGDSVIAPKLNTDEAIQFLLKWDPDGARTLVAFQPKQNKGDPDHVIAASFAVGEEEAMRAWINDYNGRWNLYFLPNRCDPSVKTQPRKPHMRFMRCFHLDVDLPKGAKATPEALAELLARIRQFEPQPHVIVFSGGGYQAFWLFEAERACGDGGLERVEQDNKHILKQVNGDSSCFNANRVMRLPGTVNVLSPIKRERGRVPALACVVDENWDAPRYRFGRDVLPHMPERDDPTGPEGDGDGDGESAQGVRTQTVDDLPPKLKKAILTGDATTHGGDRSKLVWYIVCSLGKH